MALGVCGISGRIPASAFGYGGQWTRQLGTNWGPTFTLRASQFARKDSGDESVVRHGCVVQAVQAVGQFRKRRSGDRDQISSKAEGSSQVRLVASMRNRISGKSVARFPPSPIGASSGRGLGGDKLGTRLPIRSPFAYNANEAWFWMNILPGKNLQRITSPNAKRVKCSNLD